ncbi:MAG: sensor domain-containing diguanylate cyclase [Actinomycetota bacterium]
MPKWLTEADIARMESRRPGMRRIAARWLNSRANNELAALHRTMTAVASSLSLAEVLGTLASELTRAVARADECTISIVDTDGLGLTDMATYVGGTGRIGNRGGHYVIADFPSTDRMLAAAAGFDENSLAKLDLCDEARAFMSQAGWRSSLDLPLVVDGSSVGLVELADYDSMTPWNAHDIMFARAIALQAAVAVRNARMYESLAARVDSDALTGLLNHRAFYERLSTEITKAARTDSTLLVLAIDVDDFKLVNDQGGHQEGDRVLRLIADRLRSLRTGDIAGRLGGDEFAAILPATTHGEGSSVARRLLLDLTAVGVSVSIGLAELEPGDDSSHLLSRADARLFQAKRMGKRQLADSAETPPAQLKGA